MDPRRDPASGRIRILYLGDAWGGRPFTNLAIEPSFAVAGVPASRDHIAGTFDDNKLRKFIRVYVPRTYDDLTCKFDVIVMSDTNRILYTPAQLEWFKKGVMDSGMGLMMVGGAESFGGNGNPTWGASPVEEVLPVRCRDQRVYQTTPFRVMPMRPEEPFIKAFPWRTMPLFQGMNLVAAKEGAEILLEGEISPPSSLLVYWEVGRGCSVAHTPDWNGYWIGGVGRWEYYIDYVVSLNFLSAGTAIPQDLGLVHAIRGKFFDFHSSKLVVISILEFAADFGARTVEVETHLSTIEDSEKEAENLYVLQNYGPALSKLEEVEKELKGLLLDTLKLKDKALAWIYLIEWLAITGTGLVCGASLWALMVRRALYKEARSTRMASRYEAAEETLPPQRHLR